MKPIIYWNKWARLTVGLVLSVALTLLLSPIRVVIAGIVSAYREGKDCFREDRVIFRAVLKGEAPSLPSSRELDQ